MAYSVSVRTRALVAQTAPSRVIHAEVDWGLGSGRRSRLWMLVDSTGPTELALNRDAWDGEELERLRERLGLPLEVVEKPLRPREMRKEWPGTTSWPAAHPVLLTYLAVVAIVGLVIALGA